MNFMERQRKLRAGLTKSRLDWLVVSHLPNIHYLCGFTGSAGFLVVGESRSIFFSDSRYDTQAREEVKGGRIVIARTSVLQVLGEWIRKQSPGRSRIGIEADHMTVAERRRLADILPSRLKLTDAPPLIERQRMVKDFEELELIRNAVNLGADLFEQAVKGMRSGVLESEVAAEMEYAARRAGAEGMSFPTIIASGERSALPHGRATSNPVRANGFVVCDFGVILAGYCSDQTRTVWVGEISAEARRAYDAVREAQQAAIEAVRPGVSAGAVDNAARTVLRKAKLGRYFTHSTGHGVGLEVHEPPRVASGQQDLLEPGMVLTVEPGIYLPGQWGVRIEDMVLVTKSGHQVLTPTSKDLLVV